jgi:hypothetical protein
MAMAMPNILIDKNHSFECVAPAPARPFLAQVVVYALKCD